MIFLEIFKIVCFLTLFENSYGFVTSWVKNSYVVSLAHISTQNHFCSGTIINSHTVVTAASCLLKQPHVNPDNVVVLLSPRMFRTFSVDRITVHPLYNLTSGTNDIAVLHLISSTYWSLSSTKFLEVGGSVGINSTAYSLQLDDDKIVKNKLLTTDSDYHVCLSSNYVICAVNEAKTCVTDAGGPIINIRRQFVGIIPFKKGDCSKGVTKSYIRVAPYRFWIEETINSW